MCNKTGAPPAVLLKHLQMCADKLFIIPGWDRAATLQSGSLHLLCHSLISKKPLSFLQLHRIENWKSALTHPLSASHLSQSVRGTLLCCCYSVSSSINISQSLSSNFRCGDSHSLIHSIIPYDTIPVLILTKYHLFILSMWWKTLRILWVLLFLLFVCAALCFKLGVLLFSSDWSVFSM